MDIFAYLAVFYIKLVVMSRWAKSRDATERKQYMVEGLFTTAIGFIVVLVLMGLVGVGLILCAILLLSYRGVVEKRKSCFSKA